MSTDMSSVLPAGLPDDWMPAILDNVDATSLTFSTAEETVVREFASGPVALSFTAQIAPGFDYSASRNAVRLSGGEVVVLPEPYVVRTRVDASECTLRAGGHNAHWIPALRSARGPESDWVEVEMLAVEGNRITFRTPEETLSVYHHDPLRFSTAVEYNERWSILRAPRRGGAAAVFTFSTTPLTPCTARTKPGA